MLFLTQDAVLVCRHENGKVSNTTTQDWVTIEHRLVMVDDNPENRPIAGCPNYGPTIKPCVKTLKVKQGYSDLLRIGGKRICLDTVIGLTDGTPPGTVEYKVRTPGQGFVSEKA